MLIPLRPDLKRKEASKFEVQTEMRLAEHFINRVRACTKYEEAEYVSGLTHPQEKDYYHFGLLGYLSQAYSNHECVTIQPQDFWFVVLTELSKVIRKPQHVEPCRSLFTTSQSSTEITVPTDDVTKIDWSRVVSQLEGLCPTDTSLFLPELSTHDDYSDMACKAAFCEAVQEYYSYSTMLCGIPAVKVTGTEKDWNNLVDSCRKLADLLSFLEAGKVSEYLCNVRMILESVLISLHDTDRSKAASFWQDIYTQKNVGSGSDLTISGWITTLFYEKRQMRKLENYEAVMAVVPYKNLETKRQFIGVNGAFSSLRRRDGFLQLDYSQLVFERKS